MLKPKENGRILTLPPGRSADFPVRSNVKRQEGFRRLLEPWEGRGLLRTGESALRWRCQDAPKENPKSDLPAGVFFLISHFSFLISHFRMSPDTEPIKKRAPTLYAIIAIKLFKG